MSTMRLPNKPPHGPLTGGGRARRAAPFGILGAAVLATYLATYASTIGPAKVAALLGIGVVIVAFGALMPWARLPQEAQIAIPIAVIGMIVAMQVLAVPGDIDAEVLFFAPVLWTALYGTRWEVGGITALIVVAVVVLQSLAYALDMPIGLTGWTEVVAVCGTLILLAYFLSVSRSDALTDSLTGLVNRRAWDDMLELELSRARRYGLPGDSVVVAIIDLDNFKQFNDTHGHVAGDDHLVQCARAWTESLRATDVLARIGGEEFAVLLLCSTDDACRDALERLAAATPNGETCSIGAARWDGHEDAAALMARADDALYAAKDAGRDRIVAAGPRLSAVA